MNVDGTCHCGQISYQAEVDPAQVMLCNCSDCQMLTGTAFRVSVPAPRAGFRLLSGQPTTYIKTADSGTKRAHSFCPNCGTPVYACAVADEPPSYSLRVGGLRQRHQLPPQRRIWCKSALAWAQNVSAIPGKDVT
jgi:hypothetical protein